MPLFGHNCFLTKSFVLLFTLSACEAWWGKGNQERILLKDVNAITLHHGQMTTGRRNSPVPQIMCTGGRAANAFTPLVVQCYNRGSDGYDTQWECKADMDNEYRFGHVEVSCEGYDKPDDPYILRGSCGLEYTLEYTKEGLDKLPNSTPSDRLSRGLGRMLILIMILVVIYVTYRFCYTRFAARMRDSARCRAGPYNDPPPPYPGPPQSSPLRRDDFNDEAPGCKSGLDSSTEPTAPHEGLMDGNIPADVANSAFHNPPAYDSSTQHQVPIGCTSHTTSQHADPQPTTSNSGWGSWSWHKPGWGSSGWGGSGWGNPGRSGSRWGSIGWSTSGASSNWASVGKTISSSGTRIASGFGRTKRR